MDGPIASDVLDAAMAQTLADMAEEAAALHELSQSRGYLVIMSLLDRIEQDLGRYGLRDMKTPREYYVGAQDIVAKLRALVPLLVERGAEAEARRLVTERPDYARRFVDGGGGLA